MGRFRFGKRMFLPVRSRPDLKHLPVFVVSGKDDLSTIRHAYEFGANSFLAKPCKPVDVENLIQGFPQYWRRPTTGP